MKELLRILSGLLAVVVCISTLRTGKRAGGAGLKAPMSGFVPYANKVRDVELESILEVFAVLAAGGASKAMIVNRCTITT